MVSRRWWVVFAAVVLPACRSAGARVWNLREVHRPDGRHQFVGRLRSDVAYLLGRALGDLSPARASFLEGRERRIADPLGTCLQNLLALEETDPRREDVGVLQAEGFGWLAVDCESLLSREAATRSLLPLARALGVEGPLDPPAPAEAASAEALQEAYDELVRTARPLIRGEGGSPEELREAVEAIGRLLPDRAGTTRLLRTTNVLLERDPGGSELTPLRALRRSLAKREVGLALGRCLEDPEGRVAAAGLRARLELASPDDRRELIAWAFDDPHAEVQDAELLLVAAADWIAERGLPAGEDPQPWCERLIGVVGQREGPPRVAATRALARISGRRPSIRPEVWLAWWQDQGAQAAAGGGGEP